MRALSSRPFCPCGGRWVRLRYLSAVGRYTAGLSVVHAPPGGDPHADEEAPRCGAHPGARPGQPGAPPAATPDRACQQQRQAVSHREGPDPPVEGGRPRSRDGALLRLAQFPGAPAPLATHDLIGINSSIRFTSIGARIPRLNRIIYLAAYIVLIPRHRKGRIFE